MEYKLVLNDKLEMVVNGIKAVEEIVNMAYMADQLEKWVIIYNDGSRLGGSGENACYELSQCVEVYNLK